MVMEACDRGIGKHSAGTAREYCRTELRRVVFEPRGNAFRRLMRGGPPAEVDPLQAVFKPDARAFKGAAAHVSHPGGKVINGVHDPAGEIGLGCPRYARGVG